MIPTHAVFRHLPDAFTRSLGYLVSVAPGGAAPRQVRAIVRATMAELAGASGDAAPGVKGKRIPASFAETDVPGVRDGDPVTVVEGGPVWRVREPEPDGRGMVRCELERN